jgi:CDGSH-type Zn-finger protein
MTARHGFSSAPPPGQGAGSGGGPEPLELPAGVHQLCSCGRSRHGWFCDGAHLGSGRVAYELRLSEPASLPMCGCGRSRRYPLCDGRHALSQRRPWWRFWG